MSSNQIPGVPDGWELVHANRAVKPEEHFIDRAGNALYWGAEEESAAVYPIIRKIEKPAAYRPFVSCVEIEPFFNRNLRWKNGTIGLLRISIADKGGIFIGSANYTFQRAFDVLVLDDGTPFGVKIDGE
jgi:hypothetical protein